MMYPTEIIWGAAVGKKNHYSAATRKDGTAYIFKDPILKQYEQNFCRQCTLYKDKHISSPFILYLAWYTNSKTQDIDNVVTSILDCLQMCGAIENDVLCRKIVAERRPAKGQPRVKFAIETLYDEPQLFNLAQEKRNPL